MVSLLLAALAIAASLAPAPLDLAALAFAVLAAAAGLEGYRRRDRAGAERLRAAAGAFLGAAVFALGVTKVILTAVAIRHLAASI